MTANILVVEESASLRAALRTALPPDEFKISTAATTLDFLTACATSAPDLILLGLNLQGVSGTELLRSIQQQERMSHTPVIMIASQPADPNIGRMLDAGAVDCICAPPSDCVLQKRVRNALRTARLLKERRLTRDSENAAAKASSDILSEMSREIRTTMTAILGYADVLIDQNPGQAGSWEALETIKRNGRELLHVAGDVLDVSQIEAETLWVANEECSPRQIARDVVSQMRTKAEAKGLRLESTTVETVPFCIRTDPARLLQILGNLVDSAIQSLDDGLVRVITCLPDDEDESTLQFDVIGTGISVSELNQSEAPVSLTPADPSSPRPPGGDSLRLTISRKWARALGGVIAVLSAAGRECGYRLTIAAASGGARNPVFSEKPGFSTKALEKSEPSDRAAPPSRTIRDCRILLAEDSLDNQRLISFMLRQEGAQITVAENGQIALDLARAASDEANPFDVILMDMYMPVLDGFTATSRLRAEGYTGPIIALTANAMHGAREMCIAAGCDEYTTKPVDRRKLVRLVADHLGQHRTRSAERTL